ncbi:MAG: hypothetical protein AAF899_11445, partial [Pseudomonadota bacterium]
MHGADMGDTRQEPEAAARGDEAQLGSRFLIVAFDETEIRLLLLEAGGARPDASLEADDLDGTAHHPGAHPATVSARLLGSVPVADDGSVDGARLLALAGADAALPSILWLPAAQVAVGEVRLPRSAAPSPSALAAMAVALTGQTSGDLAVGTLEWAEAGAGGDGQDGPALLLVTYAETVIEARSYAEGWGFTPVAVSTNLAHRLPAGAAPTLHAVLACTLNPITEQRERAVAAAAASSFPATVDGDDTARETTAADARSDTPSEGRGARWTDLLEENDRDRADLQGRNRRRLGALAIGVGGLCSAAALAVTLGVIPAIDLLMGEGDSARSTQGRPATEISNTAEPAPPPATGGPVTTAAAERADPVTKAPGAAVRDRPARSAAMLSTDRVLTAVLPPRLTPPIVRSVDVAVSPAETALTAARSAVLQPRRGPPPYPALSQPAREREPGLVERSGRSEPIRVGAPASMQPPRISETPFKVTAPAATVIAARDTASWPEGAGERPAWSAAGSHSDVLSRLEGQPPLAPFSSPLPAAPRGDRLLAAAGTPDLPEPTAARAPPAAALPVASSDFLGATTAPAVVAATRELGTWDDRTADPPAWPSHAFSIDLLPMPSLGPSAAPEKSPRPAQPPRSLLATDLTEPATVAPPAAFAMPPAMRAVQDVGGAPVSVSAAREAVTLDGSASERPTWVSYALGTDLLPRPGDGPSVAPSGSPVPATPPRGLLLSAGAVPLPPPSPSGSRPLMAEVDGSSGDTADGVENPAADQPQTPLAILDDGGAPRRWQAAPTIAPETSPIPPHRVARAPSQATATTDAIRLEATAVSLPNAAAL